MKSLAAVVALAALPAYAGPDATMKRLMNEPASILDIGIMRMERMFGDRDDIPYGRPVVAFLFDENEIAISSRLWETYKDEAAAKSACRTWFDAIRTVAGINLATGNPYDAEGSRFSSYFSHDGFTTTRDGVDLDSLRTDLDKKFTLAFSVFYDDPGVVDMTMTCTGKLLDTGFSVKVE